MPRAALTVLLLAALGGRHALSQGRPNPHLDPSLVPVGCPACHKGHGAPGSPMLPGPQEGVCLTCHGTQADLDRPVAAGPVSASARPALMARVLSLPSTHPLNDRAVSASADAVTCTSCHSPHRGMPLQPAAAAPGIKRISPGDPTKSEAELCESCHGSAGVTTGNLRDLSRLLSPSNPSFHPVEAPSLERSPSLAAERSGREVNCTDCHGNADPAGVRGPHGSAVPHVLRAAYAMTDGAPESPSSYALCYGCHDRRSVLQASPFPGHASHVEGQRASCATCHNAHGSTKNRALVRFGEETDVAGVSPSLSGRLAFVSSGPGSGSCYLTCHGKNHDPLAYGAAARPGLPLDPRRPRVPAPGRAVPTAPLVR